MNISSLLVTLGEATRASLTEKPIVIFCCTKNERMAFTSVNSLGYSGEFITVNGTDIKVSRIEKVITIYPNRPVQNMVSTMYNYEAVEE